MKNNTVFRALSPVGLAALLAGGCMSNSRTTAASAETHIKRAEIRDVISRVAKHQVRPLADGDYPAVTSLDPAKAAKPPEGIAWNYPWGVTLYGMLRASDVTGDKEAQSFVVQHDKICARDYEW